MKKYSKPVAFILLFISVLGIVLAALEEYNFNGLVLLLMVIAMTCSAYLVNHDFTI